MMEENNYRNNRNSYEDHGGVTQFRVFRLDISAILKKFAFLLDGDI